MTSSVQRDKIAGVRLQWLMICSKSYKLKSVNFNLPNFVFVLNLKWVRHCAFFFHFLIENIILDRSLASRTSFNLIIEPIISVDMVFAESWSKVLEMLMVFPWFASSVTHRDLNSQDK